MLINNAIKKNCVKGRYFSSFLFLLPKRYIITKMQRIRNSRGKDREAPKLLSLLQGNHSIKLSLLSLRDQSAEFSPLPRKPTNLYSRASSSPGSNWGSFFYCFPGEKLEVEWKPVKSKETLWGITYPSGSHWGKEEWPSSGIFKKK